MNVVQVSLKRKDSNIFSCSWVNQEESLKKGSIVVLDENKNITWIVEEVYQNSMMDSKNLARR